MLLHCSADINVYNELGYQLFHLAVQKGDTTMTTMFFNHKNTNINERAMDRSRFTALHQAAYNGHLSIVNLYLHRKILISMLKMRKGELLFGVLLYINRINQ